MAIKSNIIIFVKSDPVGNVLTNQPVRVLGII